MNKYKIILIGPAGVGKSSFLFQIKSSEQKKFTEIRNYSPTIGVDFYSKIISIGGREIKIHIWDTAGQERFDCIVDSYYKDIDMVILMYDITHTDTNNHIQKYMQKINFFAKDVPTLLIGNKTDMETNICYKINKNELQKECNIINHFEISCFDIDNINYVMDYISNYVVNNIKKSSEDNIIILDDQRKNKKNCCF